MRSYSLKAQGDAVVAPFRDELGHFVPGPDGATFFTGTGDRRDASGKLIGRVEPDDPRKPREIALPSIDPSYYLMVGGLPSVAYQPHQTSSAPGAVTASVHAEGDGSRLFTVYGLDEMATTVKLEDWYPDDVTTDKRFHFIPAANLLVTIPPSNDCLVLRRVDVAAVAGGDRLVVVSPTALSVTAGEKLQHRIVARSKKGGITYTLSSGPDGLVVSKDGQLTWTAPSAQKGEEVTAVVTVGDPSGDEVFHTLKIRVR